jgi:hypothetical protein
LHNVKFDSPARLFQPMVCRKAYQVDISEYTAFLNTDIAKKVFKNGRLRF